LCIFVKSFFELRHRNSTFCIFLELRRRKAIFFTFCFQMCPAVRGVWGFNSFSTCGAEARAKLELGHICEVVVATRVVFLFAGVEAPQVGKNEKIEILPWLGRNPVCGAQQLEVKAPLSLRACVSVMWVVYLM